MIIPGVMLLVAGILTAGGSGAEFPGWQGMRVMEQDGRPLILKAGDINGDGRDEVVVVNTQYSRLDIYRWLPKGSRTAAEPVDKDRPNDLPMAIDFKRDELQLEHLPRDLVIQDIDGDGRPELVVLVSPPNRLLVYAWDKAGHWRQRQAIDLLAGEIAPRQKALLLRPAAGSRKRDLLISFAEGVQIVQPGADTRAAWLTPREEQPRVDWWLADVDGDGDDDVVEQCRNADEAVRWYPCSGAGNLMSAQVLFDRALTGVEVLDRGRKAAELLLVDGSSKTLLRRYRLTVGKKGPVGRRRSLAVAGGRKGVWCGVQLGKQHALVAADTKQPRLLVYPLGPDGWEPEQVFPAVASIQGLAPVMARPGTLLLWAKDAADLQISRWEHGRLSFPKPWTKSADVPDRTIVALASVGATTWWVQRVGKDLHLYRWGPAMEEPQRTVFANVGPRTKDVLWLGDARMLAKDVHARSAKLVVNSKGKTVVTEPGRLKKIPMPEFRVFPFGKDVRVGRLADGVLQWLGDDLQPVDQIMLPQGQEMVDYVVTDPRGGWALQKDGKTLHRLVLDDKGIAQVVARTRLHGGLGLARDPVLGIVLLDQKRITLLRPGQPWELNLVDIVDGRVGRAAGIKKIAIDRAHAVDLNGDGKDEVLLFDDHRHRLMALQVTAGRLAPAISWRVFDDKKYPYADSTEKRVREPRAVVALDVDGDRHRDLALLCHDRLILYLAKDPP